MSVGDRTNETAIGFACAGAVVLLWSGFITLSRLGAKTSFGPLDLMALRFAGAGLIMLPVLLRRGFGGLTLPQVALLAGTAGLGFSLLAFWGFSRAPATHAAVLMPGVLPLYTAVLAWAVTGEALPRRRITGLLLILLGVGVVAWDSILLPAATGSIGGQWIGDLCFLGAAFTWAIFTIALRAWRVDPVQATAMVVIPSALLFLPVYLLLPGQRLWTAPPGEIAFQAVYQGLFATILSMLAYTRAVRALGAARTAIATSLTPVAAGLLAIPVAGEVPSWLNALGLLLVTLGMLIGTGAPATTAANSGTVPGGAELPLPSGQASGPKK